MSVHQIPMYGPEGRVPDFGKKTVPVTVYIKNGHMVNPGEGECYVVGSADVDGTMVNMTLMDHTPEAVMDALVGDKGAKFSIALSPGERFFEE